MALKIGDRFDEVTVGMSHELNQTQVGHFKLVDGMYEVVPNEHPTESDIRNDRIAKLKRCLSNTDYVAIKYAEGLLTDEEYAPVREQRKAWRAEINSLSE